MFLKRNGDLKTGGHTDGRRQRPWTDKHSASSPAPAMELIKCIPALCGSEERDTAMFHLLAQFLQTEMDKASHLCVKGVAASLLVESDPEQWNRHLRTEKCKPVICMRCSKAICSTLIAATLACEKPTGCPEEWGFSMNPCDPCVCGTRRSRANN